MNASTKPALVEPLEREMSSALAPRDSDVLGVLSRAEIDQQIATAHKFPRSVDAFRKRALGLVSLNESIARGCVYALPRDGKVIEGPSVRFAEIIQSTWGNARSGARVVDVDDEYVTAQGIFHDLQSNSAICYEVRRRITNKKGQRFNADMIGVTANAACSIALRNAIQRGIPRAFWDDIYEAARKTIMGDFKTLENRRQEAIKAFMPYGVTKEQIFELLKIGGLHDMQPEHLVQLHGVLNAIKEEGSTPEEIFGSAKPKPEGDGAAAAGAATAGGAQSAGAAAKPNGDPRPEPPAEGEGGKVAAKPTSPPPTAQAQGGEKAAGGLFPEDA